MLAHRPQGLACTKDPVDTGHLAAVNFAWINDRWMKNDAFPQLPIPNELLTWTYVSFSCSPIPNVSSLSFLICLLSVIIVSTS